MKARKAHERTDPRQLGWYDAEYALQADGERNQLLPCETVMDEERRESYA